MSKKPAFQNDDIGEETRLELYRSQVNIREAEQRAFDLFLQNLVKGTSHLSLGQEAVAAGFAVGQQVFTLPAAVPVKTVYLAHKLQYKKTAVNASLINIWEQTAPDEITLTQGTILNNYLYIEY